MSTFFARHRGSRGGVLSDNRVQTVSHHGACYLGRTLSVVHVGSGPSGFGRHSTASTGEYASGEGLSA